MSKALTVAIALALAVRHGAEAACTPCKDACASDGFRRVESSKDNNFLEYHANTSAIPELKTPVRMVLVNRPGKPTTNTPRALSDNAEILKQVKQWAEAIEAGQEPPKPMPSGEKPTSMPMSQSKGTDAR